MNYHTREVENGVEIIVDAEEAAVVVKENGEERIYLSGRGKQQSTYYTANNIGLEEHQEGFKLVHEGTPDSVEVFSTAEN